MRIIFISLILLSVFFPGFAQTKTIGSTEPPVRITRAIGNYTIFYSKITITSDSAACEYNFGVAHTSVHKTIAGKTKGWSSLIKKIDLKKIDMTPQNKTRIAYETGGIDTVYTIEINNNEKHVLTNPDQFSPLYLQITPFINELDNIIQNLRESDQEYPIRFTECTNFAENGSHWTEITKDHIIYQQIKSGQPTNKLKKRSRQINPKDWNALVNAFSAKKFAAVKSTETNAGLDGTDFYYIVETNFGTYSIVNPLRGSPELELISPYQSVFDLISQKYIKK